MPQLMDRLDEARRALAVVVPIPFGGSTAPGPDGSAAPMNMNREPVQPIAGEASEMSDATLLAATSCAEELARAIDVIRVECAGEVARRSAPARGELGLASRRGCRDATAMIRSITRSGYQDVARRIRVSELLADSNSATTTTTSEAGEVPPLAVVANAVRDGLLGIDAADQIARALAPIVSEADPDSLRDATIDLVSKAQELDADEVGRVARGLRTSLDRVGVAARETELREKRSLRRGRVHDGLRRMTLMLDPESDAVFSGALDAAMSPRLGGPRFTDPDKEARAQRLRDDARTNEQIALDVLVELLRIGVACDDGVLLGGVKPAVRVTIPLKELTKGIDSSGRPIASADQGVGWIEGVDEPVSASTARRYLCDVGALPIVLGGEGEPLDVGRTRRLFSPAQRIALANRDGGCRWPSCDRPPSWCEAHHINPFNDQRAGRPPGRTDIREGMLLCRRHHLLLHNHGWWIERTGPPNMFRLIPPVSVDALQTPRAMRSKRPEWLGSG